MSYGPYVGHIEYFKYDDSIKQSISYDLSYHIIYLSFYGLSYDTYHMSIKTCLKWYDHDDMTYIIWFK